MSEKKKTSFGKNLILNNPVFSLYLGICSTLAISTSLNNALGMGLAVTAVLICSNVLVSIVAKITPDDVHIPVYIVIIATLVTITYHSTEHLTDQCIALSMPLLLVLFVF